MLRIIYGKAGSGKTAFITAEIKQHVEAGSGKVIMLVPEQYSHEAERELCSVCGDSLSLYGEVLSFSGLAREVSLAAGGAGLPSLDPGGQLLCMALAAANVKAKLKVFSAAADKPELRSMLLSAVSDVKAAAVSPGELLAAAEAAGGLLGDKLHDLALICEAYDAVALNGHADPADRLTRLKRQLDSCPSALAEVKHIYADGFTDFTRQELNVLYAVLDRGADLTVCFTLDALSNGNEIFTPSLYSANALMRYAEERGIACETEVLRGVYGKSEALAYFNDRMFSYAPPSGSIPDGSACRLYTADSITAECENAAAVILELVRTKGLRWKDIAIAVRGFDSYRAELKAVLGHYGIPLFCALKTDLLSMPLPAFIIGIYKITCNGWDSSDIISFLHTGLTPLSPCQCDILETYITRWNIKISDWKKDGDWEYHPDGGGFRFNDVSIKRLEEINRLRRIISEPLLRFEAGSLAASGASEQVAALTDCLEAFALPERLRCRAEELRELGMGDTAAEYVQLWKIICSALTQTSAILGDMPISPNSFGNLFSSVFQAYDTTTIPVTLDAVCAGDFDRMRRRNIKYLLVLGASDDKLPRQDSGDGFLSDAESRTLKELPGFDIELGHGTETEVWREFNLIYNTLSLPSDGLIMSYCTTDEEGKKTRPAFVFGRLQKLLRLTVLSADTARCRAAAPAPALSLAGDMTALPALRIAAEEYFSGTEEGRARLSRLRAAASLTRGRLSPKSVTALYGKSARLSASGINSFSGCRFGYFCKNGLRAKRLEPEDGMPANIYGLFVHKALEIAIPAIIEECGSISAAGEDTVNRIAGEAIESAKEDLISGFEDRSERFKYLFKLLCGNVKDIICDCVDELKRSDFVPCETEFQFTGGEGDSPIDLKGFVDRVDVLQKDGKRYLRIADYKTGKDEFSLSDIWYGRNQQLMLYLSALSETGAYSDAVPAGVEIIPARRDTVKAESSGIDDSEINASRQKLLKRSGLCLDDPAVLEAWERGEDKIYIPVAYSKKGEPDPKNLAGADGFDLVFKHIDSTCREMTRELNAGSIDAAPYWTSESLNACLYCEFKDACGFENGTAGEKVSYEPKLKPDEVWEKLKSERGEEE